MSMGLVQRKGKYLVITAFLTEHSTSGESPTFRPKKTPRKSQNIPTEKSLRKSPGIPTVKNLRREEEGQSGRGGYEEENESK